MDCLMDDTPLGILWVDAATTEGTWSIFHLIQDEWSPLHLAASRGKADVVKFLLENGANKDAQEKVRGLGLLWFYEIRDGIMVGQIG